MDVTAPAGRAARLLAVLAVLFGLLAMHGVASPHHAAAAPTTGAPAAEPAHTHDHNAAAAPAAPPAAWATAALSGPTVPSCQDDCPAVTALCVAVLTGAALAVLLGHRRASWLPLAPFRRRDRTPRPAARQAQGPDPVRELCISRT